MNKILRMSLRSQLLISLVVAIVFSAVNVTRQPLILVLTFVLALVGTFVLDIEYPLYAYVFEGGKEFSINLRAYISHRDFKGALNYIIYNNDKVEDKSLNSALFQMVFAALTLFVAYAELSPLIKVLVYSVFANSIYRMLESYFVGTLKDWFWEFKNAPGKGGVAIYSAIMIAVLILSFII